MVRNLIRNVAFLAAIGLGLTASNAQAAFIGSFGVNAISPVIAPDGSLANATTFTLASMAGNGNTSGGFIGVVTPATTFTGNSFTVGTSTGFSFTNPTVGTFTETTAPVLTSTSIVNGVVTGETFFILGSFSGGPVGSATPTSFTVAFTQNGGPNTSISASGTLNIPPTGTVPEPASVAMLGIGLVTFAGYGLRRRFTK